jgi:type IV fimbrial biogenesis protein FimT
MLPRTPTPRLVPLAAAGFTLVEIAVALTLAALVASVTMPAFADWIAAYRLGNHARHLAEWMSRARAEAVRRGMRVNLCKSADGWHCASAGGWESGLLLHVDENRDGARGEGEAVLAAAAPAPPGITVQANQPLDAYVSFTSHGHARLTNGALQMGTFTVCQQGQQERRVVLSAGGRIRIETGTDRCA